MNEVLKMEEKIIRTCEDCGCVIEDNDDFYEVNGNIYCEDCYNDNFEPCGDCGAVHHRDEMYWVEGYDYYVCEDCYDDYDECANCGSLERRNNMYRSEDGNICEYCADYNYTTCDDCGARVHNDYIRYDEDSDYYYFITLIIVYK